MPNKKKKYDARFPPARIKKIMQSDDNIGKVAAPVPVIISRALELFATSLIEKAGERVQATHAKTLNSYHIKQAVEAYKQFDFLKHVVADVQDRQVNEEEDESDYRDKAADKKTSRGKKQEASMAHAPSDFHSYRRKRCLKKYDSSDEETDTDLCPDRPESDGDDALLIDSSPSTSRRLLSLQESDRLTPSGRQPCGQFCDVIPIDLSSRSYEETHLTARGTCRNPYPVDYPSDRVDNFDHQPVNGAANSFGPHRSHALSRCPGEAHAPYKYANSTADATISSTNCPGAGNSRDVNRSNILYSEQSSAKSNSGQSLSTAQSHKEPYHIEAQIGSCTVYSPSTP